MRKEKRKNARATVHAHATIDYANVEQEKATLVDLAQDGMRCSLEKNFLPSAKFIFSSSCQDRRRIFACQAQVVWQDWSGRAGFQFVDVPKTSRRLLTDYLSANVPSDARPQKFPDVTVEMEEPLQLALISVAEQTHGKPTTQGAHTILMASLSP